MFSHKSKKKKLFWIHQNKKWKTFCDALAHVCYLRYPNRTSGHMQARWCDVQHSNRCEFVNSSCLLLTRWSNLFIKVVYCEIIYQNSFSESSYQKKSMCYSMVKSWWICDFFLDAEYSNWNCFSSKFRSNRGDYFISYWAPKT